MAGERRPRRNSPKPKRYEHGDDAPDAAGVANNGASAETSTNNVQEEKPSTPRIKLRVGRKRKAPPSDDDHAENDGDEDSGEEGDAVEVKVRVTLGGKSVLSKACRALLDSPLQDNDDEEAEEESEEDSAQESGEEEEEGSDDEEEQVDDIDEETLIKHPHRKCRAEGCYRYKEARSEGYCRLHYEELHGAASGKGEGGGSPGTGAPKGRQCVAKGCVKYKAARCEGYCRTCYEARQEGTHEEEEEEVEEEVEEESAEEEEEGEGEVCKVRVRIQRKLTKRVYEAVVPEGLLGRVRGKGEASSSSSEEEEVEAEEVAKTAVKKEEQVEEMDEEKKEEEDAKPAAKEEAEEVKDAKPAATPSKADAALPPDWKSKLDFEVMPTPQRKVNGATKCRAVGCPKNSQGNSAGFCRAHHNRYLIGTGQCGSWECKCGQTIADFQARCGKCHRWRGGIHPGKKDGSGAAKRGSAAAVEATSGGADDDDDAMMEGVVLHAPTRNYPNLGLTHVPPDADVEISATLLTNARGRSLCKVIGCGKLDQSQNDGFCRMHFNLFSIEAGQPTWTCACGTEMSSKNKRCGDCNKWREGKRETHPVDRSHGISVDNIIRDDDWTCDCGNRVPRAKARCGKCHHWRGGRRSGGWKLGAGTFAAANHDGDDGIDRTAEWTCCGTVIPAEKSRCGKCNGWRGGKRVAAGKTTSKGGRKRASESGSDVVEGHPGWHCAKCNFDNFAGELSCFVCKAARPNWQYHQRQQLIASGAAGAPKHPVQATNRYASTQPDGSVVLNEEAIDAALVRVAQGQLAPIGIDAGADSRNYYGACPAGPSYSYVSLHYDFNLKYYKNNQYDYLTAGLKSKEGDGGKEDTDASDSNSEHQAQEEV